jgi:hypothetical protein
MELLLHVAIFCFSRQAGFRAKPVFAPSRFSRQAGAFDNLELYSPTSINNP